MGTVWICNKGLGRRGIALLPHGDVVVIAGAEKRILILLSLLCAVDPFVHILRDTALFAHHILPVAARGLQGLQLNDVRRSYRLCIRYRPGPGKSWAPPILACTSPT